MHTLDEMLLLDLLTPDQHAAIRAWVKVSRTPERILQLPAPLWRALEIASVAMDFDADIAPPP